MNSSFNLCFSRQNLKVLAKLRHNLRQYLEFLLFFYLFFYIYLTNQRGTRLTYFLIAFVCIYSLTGSSSPLCTLFIALKAGSQIISFTLDSFILVMN